MELLLQGATALLCALGLAFLAGLFAVWLLCPACGEGAWVIVPGRRDGGRLEREVGALMCLRRLGLLRCGVAVVDLDLDPEGRELALHLCRRWDGVVLWPADRLEELCR